MCNVTGPFVISHVIAKTPAYADDVVSLYEVLQLSKGWSYQAAATYDRDPVEIHPWFIIINVNDAIVVRECEVMCGQ